MADNAIPVISRAEYEAAFAAPTQASSDTVYGYPTAGTNYTDITVRGANPEPPTIVPDTAPSAINGIPVMSRTDFLHASAIPATKPVPLTQGETFAGGMTDLLGKLSFGVGDELTAGGASILDALQGANLSQSYDSRLSQVRDLQSRYGKEHPTSAMLNNLAGLLVPIPGGAITNEGAQVLKQGGTAARFLPQLAMSAEKGIVPIAGNIAKATATGAGYAGLSGYLNGEGGIDKRLQNSYKDAKTGAIAGALFGTAAEGVRQAAPTIKAIARGADRKSLGAGVADYNKTANELGIISDADGNAVTRTKEALDDVLQSGVLGKSRNPGAINRNAEAAEQSLEDQVGELIHKYNRNNGTPVTPSFPKAYKYITDGNVPADKVEAFKKRLFELHDAIVKQGKGSLSYMQQQKIAQGKVWTEGDAVLNEFDRKIYSDLKDSIEKAIPDVGPINEKLGKWQLVKPVIKKALARSENEDPLQALKSFFFTTGGYGATIATGAKIAGIPGAIAGAGAGVAGQIAKTPRGMAEIARALNGVGNNSDALAGIGAKTAAMLSNTPETKKTPRVSQTGISKPQSNNQSLTSKILSGVKKVDDKQAAKVLDSAPATLPKSRAAAPASPLKTDVKAYIDKQPTLVQAVIMTESSGNPRAESGTGPQGLMQLSKFMQKALNVKDAFDPQENVTKGTEHLNYLLKRYENPMIALAAYNQGETVINRAIKRVEGKGQEATWGNIKGFLPREGQNYPLTVAKWYQKIQEQQSADKVTKV